MTTERRRGVEMNNIIIECNNLSKSYGNKTVLKEIDIKIPAGITGIVAPNGYGKTTFIEICCGIRKNFSGEIKVLGQKVGNSRNDIGFISDKPAFPGNIKVFDYIKIISDIYGTTIDKNIISLSGIENVYGFKIKNLSAGYLKRFAFIIAIIHKPKLIFADEPFSNVDTKAIKIMQKMIVEANKNGTSVFIASHDLMELTSIANKIFLINNNKLKEIEYEDNKNTIEIISSNNNDLYNILRNDFNVVNNNDSLIVNYDDLKKLLLKLSNFDGKILKIRTINHSEGLLDELYKAIDKS